MARLFACAFARTNRSLKPVFSLVPPNHSLERPVGRGNAKLITCCPLVHAIKFIMNIASAAGITPNVCDAQCLRRPVSATPSACDAQCMRCPVRATLSACDTYCLRGPVRVTPSACDAQCVQRPMHATPSACEAQSMRGPMRATPSACNAHCAQLCV